MRTHKNKQSRWRAGYFGVDSGLCIIGDPLYLKDFLERDWADISAGFGHTKNIEQIRDLDGLELGVWVRTGVGDGVYPVYVTTIQDSLGYERIAAVHIEFMRPPRRKITNTHD